MTDDRVARPAGAGPPRTIIIGIGSLLRGDDAVGLRVAEALEGEGLPSGVTVVSTTAAGLSLLELMTGFDRALVIDAIKTRRGTPGDVYRLVPEDLPEPLHGFTVHDVSLRAALDIGARMGLPLPEQIVILAIEAGDVTPLRESCTPEVEEAVPRAVSLALRELQG